MAVAVVAAGVFSALALGRPAELVFSGSYAVDPGLGVLRLVVLAATALTLLLASDAIAGTRRETAVVVRVLLAALETIVLAGADDLLMFAAGFLLTSLPLYALTGMTHTRRSTEAALKQ